MNLQNINLDNVHAYHCKCLSESICLSDVKDTPLDIGGGGEMFVEEFV